MLCGGEEEVKAWAWLGWRGTVGIGGLELRDAVAVEGDAEANGGEENKKVE